MIKIKRQKTKIVKIGNIKIGSGYPIAIQSMVKVSAKNIDSSIEQIKRLESVGCEIIRIAVEDKEDAAAIKDIRRAIKIPIVADIHFNYKLALAAIEAGADKIRLNPGNVFRPIEVKAVIDAAKAASIPIRIGANSGSLRVQSGSTATALVKSVVDYIKIFKKEKFNNLVISLKGSDIMDTIEAYKLMSRACDYPLHLGVTATGVMQDGIVKSSVALGMLLFQGIGDTIRVSLLGPPEEEVRVAKFLLSSLKLRSFGPELICCPTCGRCEVDLRKKAQDFEEYFEKLSPKERLRFKNYKVALMGCVVNGPGDAKEADLGIAFSRQKAILFQKGKQLQSVSLDEADKLLLQLMLKGK